VGRTGRAGVAGTATTLVTVNDKEFAGHLVRNLESAGQVVPKELYDLAMQSSWFKNSRFKSGRGKGTGGAGLGFKERPALGWGGGGGGGGAGGGSSSNKDDTTISEQFRYDKKHKQGMAVPKQGGTDRLSAVKQVSLYTTFI
jgi:superfamily II DNA/RNA helicase